MYDLIMAWLLFLALCGGLWFEVSGRRRGGREEG